MLVLLALEVGAALGWDVVLVLLALEVGAA